MVLSSGWYPCTFENLTSRTKSISDPPHGDQMGLRVQAVLLTNLSTLSAFLPSGSVLFLPWLQTLRSERFLSHCEIPVPNAGEGNAFQGLPKHCREMTQALAVVVSAQSVSAPGEMDPPLHGVKVTGEGWVLYSQFSTLPDNDQPVISQWLHSKNEDRPRLTRIITLPNPTPPWGQRLKKQTLNIPIGVVAPCKVVLAIEVFDLS